MSFSCPPRSKSGPAHSHSPAHQRASSRRGTASFTNPERANRAVWPAAILAAIAAEEQTSHSSVESLPADPNAWNWARFFSELARDLGSEGLGELLDEQVLDEFLRKFPHAIEMTPGRASESRHRGAFRGGPPPPAPTTSSFDHAQIRRPDSHDSFRGGPPPPPAPITSSFNIPPHPSPRGPPPGAPITSSFPASPCRPYHTREPFAGGPPPLTPTTASFSFASAPYPGPATPSCIPPGVLRRAALRATGQYMF